MGTRIAARSTAALPDRTVLTTEFEMRYLLDVTGPVKATDGSAPDPRRQFWQMTAATLEGPRIQARSAAAGIDWFTPLGDGYGCPHVRLPLLTDDGALVLLEYWGVVEASAAFQKAVAGNGSTAWDEQYMRMALRFETSTTRYQWLVQNLFIARGRLLGATTIEYEIFRVL